MLYLEVKSQAHKSEGTWKQGREGRKNKQVTYQAGQQFPVEGAGCSPHGTSWSSGGILERGFFVLPPQVEWHGLPGFVRKERPGAEEAGMSLRGVRLNDSEAQKMCLMSLRREAKGLG